MNTDKLIELLRDLLPAVDAYEMAGRRSYFKDGALHWEMTPQYWAAQRLRERVEAALRAEQAVGTARQSEGVVVVVPRNLTKEMRAAATKIEWGGDEVDECWAAMIAAAPAYGSKTNE